MNNLLKVQKLKAVRNKNMWTHIFDTYFHL